MAPWESWRTWFLRRLPRVALALSRTDRDELGVAGEALGAAHLTRLGARVLARRWRCRGIEVDLLVEDGGTWALVEVKSGRAGGVHRPGRRLDHRRLTRLRRAAARLERAARRAVRVDLVEVLVERPRAGGRGLRVRDIQWYRDLGPEPPFPASRPRELPAALPVPGPATPNPAAGAPDSTPGGRETERTGRSVPDPKRRDAGRPFLPGPPDPPCPMG